MRGMHICLVAMAWISAASAQEVVTPENGLGPYHFGMAVADIEATSAHAHWRVSDVTGVGQVLDGGPSVQVGAAHFTTGLVFSEGALRFIVLNGHASSNCVDAIRTLIEGNLEPAFGSFGSAPGPRENGDLVNTWQTAGGSEIRELVDASSAHRVFSSRRGGMFVQVKGEPAADGLQGCGVTLTFNAQAPYLGPLLTPISYQELDRAQSLVNPRWIAQPNGQSLERYFPSGAEGDAALDCLINGDGSLRCLVTSEVPRGRGFGEAALHAAQDFRVLQSDAGVSAVGKRVRISISIHPSN